MRALVPGVVVLISACSAPSSVSGESAPVDWSTDQLTLPRRPSGRPFLEEAMINSSFTGQAFTLAVGDGFGDAVLRWHSLQLGCMGGTVRWSSASVTGEVATVKLESNGDLTLHPTAEGPITLEVTGLYTPVVTCEGEHLTPRRIAFSFPVQVKEVKGYQLDSRCPDPLEWAIAYPTGVGVPPVKVRPVDSDGLPFTPSNAAEDAPVSMTLRASTPLIATSSNGFVWTFTAPGAVELRLDTALPVRNERRFRVATAQSLSALELGGAIAPVVISDEPTVIANGTTAVLDVSKRPLFIPRYLGGTAEGVELCAPPAPDAFTLVSETPEVCEAVRVESWQSRLGVGAKLLRDGRCRVRVFVTGRERLGASFDFAVENVAAAASL